MMNRRPVVALALVFAALAPAQARANSSYAHIHMSQLAAAMLPPGELRELLEDPETYAAMEAGSMFPDSGYAANDPYGEICHWEGFLHSFMEDLKARYGGDYSSREARLRIAFMLGFAAHGFEDQAYDTTLLARAQEVDGAAEPGFSEDTYDSLFLTVDHGVVIRVDDPYAPYGDLPGIIAAGPDRYRPLESTLIDGMATMSGVIALQGMPWFANSGIRDAWRNFPFLGSHYYNPEAVGSVPWLAALVADYWQILWHRLHETDDPNEHLIVHTVPEDGAVNFNVDRSESYAWGRIAIFFGYAIDRDVIRDLITLRDSSGAQVPVGFDTAYGGRDRNLLFVVPGETLAYDELYTVELAAGATTLYGETRTAPFLFSFRTRCAPDRLAECPPLAPPLTTQPMPQRDAGMRPDAGRDAGEPDAGAMDAGAPDVGVTDTDAATSPDAGPDPDAATVIDAGIDAASAPRATGGGGCTVGAPRPGDPAIAALVALAIVIARRRARR